MIDGAHPLLDEHIVSASDPGTHYWQGRLDSVRAPWLLEHRVKGAPVLPASAMVEMALHGGFTIFGEHACVVDALRLENALVIREDRPAVVQLVIERDPAGRGELPPRQPGCRIWRGGALGGARHRLSAGPRGNHG